MNQLRTRDINEVVEPPGLESEPEGCVRCGSAMVKFEEPTCPICGWRDFTYDPPNTLVPGSVIRSARRFRVRYSGEHEAMQGTVIDVEVCNRPTAHYTAEYRPSCPFCGGEMARQEMGGREKKRYKDMNRYRCSIGHFIRLADQKQGVLTWS